VVRVAWRPLTPNRLLTVAAPGDIGTLQMLGIGYTSEMKFPVNPKCWMRSRYSSNSQAGRTLAMCLMIDGLRLVEL